MQNKAINNKKDAWLAFLSCDDPERIVEIIERYPFFRGMYEVIYELCENVGKVMEMFSKDLLEMDRNTVCYMIEEQQEEIDQQKEILEQQKEEILEQQNNIQQQKEEILKQQSNIQQQKEEILKQQSNIQQQKEEIERLRALLNHDNDMQ